MIFLSRGVVVDDCVVDRKVPNMATRTPREKFQAGKRMGLLQFANTGLAKVLQETGAFNVVVTC